MCTELIMPGSYFSSGRRSANLEIISSFAGILLLEFNVQFWTKQCNFLRLQPAIFVKDYEPGFLNYSKIGLIRRFDQGRVLLRAPA